MTDDFQSWSPEKIAATHWTHELAADLFMSTATGLAAGVTREYFLNLLRARYPDEKQLTAFVQEAAKTFMQLREGPTQH